LRTAIPPFGVPNDGPSVCETNVIGRVLMSL